MPTRTFVHRLCRLCSVAAFCVLLGSFGVTVNAQSNILQPLEPSPGNSNILQPLPPGSASSAIGQPLGSFSDPSIPAEMRKGNCCILKEFDRLKGCVWGVGLDKQGQEALDSCKIIEGIHYVQGNMTSNQPDKSWQSCSIQCGVLSRSFFCDPTAYTCSEKLPDDYKVWDRTTRHPTRSSCEEACIRPEEPVDLETTVICACIEKTADDEAPGKTVLCSIDVAQNPATMVDGEPGGAAVIDSVSVSLVGGGGALTVRKSYVYDDRGNTTDIEGEVTAEDATALQFAPEKGIIIPASDPLTQESNGGTGGFHADITVPVSVALDGVLFVETISRTTDPNAANDIADAKVPTEPFCGAFGVQTRCDLPTRKHAYFFTLPESQPRQNQRVEFSLAAQGQLSCLDPSTVAMSNLMKLYCTANPADASVVCFVPAEPIQGDLQTFAPPSALKFSVSARSDAECPVGTPIPVRATITIGDGAPMVRDITEPKEGCSNCDVCGQAKTQDACNLLPVDANGIPFCNWKFDVTTRTIGCISNIQNPACSVWYGCCMVNAGVSSFLYAGRSGGQYRPAGQDRSTFGIADESRFIAAASCLANGAVRSTYWRRQPNESIDPKGEVARMAAACTPTGGLIPELPINPQRPPGNPQLASRPDWYCKFDFEDIEVSPSAPAPTLLLPVKRTPCEIFTGDPWTQSLSKGTAYAFTAYNQDDIVDDKGFSCPATCELVTKNTGTCYIPGVPIENNCQSNSLLDACNDNGGMFFTNGPLGRKSCRDRCDGELGVCDGAPPGWNPPVTTL